MTRRQWLGSFARNQAPRLLFTARGATGFLNPDRRLESITTTGRDLRVLPTPAQGCYGQFPDGRLLLMQLELPGDWRKKTFDDYYPRSRTRLWRTHPVTGHADELCHRDRLSSFYSPCCLVGDRLAVTALVAGKSVLYTMELDGSAARAITGANEFVYGVSLSPDGRWFAFHADYRIHVCRIDGSQRREIAAVPGSLCFGTNWSPDGEQVVFQVCDAKSDPAHDWSRIAVVRRDGTPLRWLSERAAAWFGASYGPRRNPGGGSNVPEWTASGVLWAKRTPGAVVPWQFRKDQKDTDHFNRSFVPSEARGGTHLVLTDPVSGDEHQLTKPRDGQWDFRPTWSTATGEVAFCRARTGENPALWIVDAVRRRERRLTAGLRKTGAEHPRFLS